MLKVYFVVAPNRKYTEYYKNYTVQNTLKNTTIL